LFVVLSILSVAFAEEGSDVLELNASNFDQAIEENSLILVEFYAPWCGHCKKLVPEYEKAATALKGSAVLAKVDGDTEENKELGQKFEIRGFPTLKVFRNKEVSDYEGERSADAIISYMKKLSLPAVSELKSADEVYKFSSDGKVVIIGFFDNVESAEYKAFHATANKLRTKFTFGAVVGNSNINNEFKVETSPTVILFKKFDEGKNVLQAAEIGELESFITINSVPTIDEIGPENYKSYVDAGLPLAYLFVDLQVEGQQTDFVNRVQKIAVATKGKINWVYIDWYKYAKHAERLGLTGKVVPALSIDNMKTGKHFAYPESKEITESDVKSWVDQYEAGTLEPTIRSEDIPESNDGPVKIVVAKNYDQIVKDENKDVFVEFYAPWCGHCKKLAPIFDELGAALKDVDTVVIAKIDATANDVDSSLGIRGFPTIKFFPANNKNAPIDYEGDRTMEDMLSFIKQNASKQFQAPEVKSSEPKDEL